MSIETVMQEAFLILFLCANYRVEWNQDSTNRNPYFRRIKEMANY
jgi:hypothetical protein